MKNFVIVVALLFSGTAFAQQQPDPAFLQRALGAMQQQRNAAMNAVAELEATRGGLAEEVAKLKARISELEKALPAPKK